MENFTLWSNTAENSLKCIVNTTYFYSSTLHPLSPNGDSEIPPGALAADPKLAFQSQMCGAGFGIGSMEGPQAQALTSKLKLKFAVPMLV